MYTSTKSSEKLKRYSSVFQMLFALIFILIGFPNLQGQTVVVNSLSAPDNDGSLIVNSSYYGAQGFTVGATDMILTSITLSLYSGVDGNNSTANISIRDHQDNTLGNLVEDLGNLTANTGYPNIADLTINSSTYPTLSANTSYWVHVTYVSGENMNWDASTTATNTGTAGTIPANFLYYNGSLISGYFVDFKVEANGNPTFTSTAVTAVNDNETYSYSIVTSDSDGDDVTVTATTKPDWLTLNSVATVSTLAGSGIPGSADGTGTAASFNQPVFMVVDGADNIYVSTYSHRIRKITPAGVVTTFAGSGDYGSANGTGVAASFANPSGMEIDASGNLFVADFGNHIIRKITPAGEVTTFAGMNGVQGSVNATGTNASFTGPMGIAIDPSGNLYVTELGGHRIRKITPAGVVTTFAGSGSQVPADGTGIAAAFNGPDAIEIDDSGNLYVTEQNSHLVRKITPAGVVTTIAGTGSTGSADGTGVNASFNTPYDVLVDGSNNLLIAEYGNHTIRKITPSGEVTTIAGLALNTGSVNGAGADARFNSPIGLAKNSAGEIFVAELGNHVIRKIVFSDQLSGDASGQVGNHNVTLSASDGNGGTATQSFTITVADATEPVFTSLTTANFAENGTGAAYTATATDDYTIAYSFGAGNDEALFDMDGSTGVVTFKSSPDFDIPSDGDGNNAYVINVIANDGTNSANQDVTISVTNVNEDPTITTTAVTTIDEGDTYTYTIITSDPDGDNITVTAPSKPSWLSIETIDGVKVTTLAGTGSAGNSDAKGTAASFNGARGLAVDASGNVYVADEYNYKIRKIATNGVVTTFAGLGLQGTVDGDVSTARFSNPSGVAIDATGNVYVVDANQVIRKIATNGVVTTLAGSPGNPGSTDGNGSFARFSGPRGIAVDESGYVYVADYYNHQIRKVAPNGDVTTVAGTGDVGSTDANGTSASFNTPSGVALDASGNIYVADLSNHKIRKIAPNGDVTTLAGSGINGSSDGNGTEASFSNPYGLTVDALGNVYVADATNQKIRKVAPNGDVTTVAGSGLVGSADGNTTDASFNIPLGVAVDDKGNLYVADFSNNYIRKIPAASRLSGNSTGHAGDHSVTLSADDGNGATAAQSFIITVNDVTTPVFTSALTASFAENGTGAAYTATATDASVLTYSLGSGNDESLFDIGGSTGAVTFKSTPDFENPADADANNTYVINVVASDGTNTANQDVTITVTDVDDTAPVFTSALTANFVENGTGAAYTATATDASVLTYSLGSGNDESLFDIVGSTGVVTFKSAPDFENPADADANNTYVINVVASDGANSANQDVTISVTDVDDTAPVFTSALTASFAENGTGAAYTATATDASVLTYSLGSGNDESLFDIVGSTGVVTFKSAPDFENPADADANNTYVINVVASDGANSANQDVTITVTDVDDTAPVFTSALTASFAENGTGAAYTATATDASALAYSLGSGNDESLFDIVGSTGVVTFKSAPDFENPADADANNTYVINVVASDGSNTANQDVTITVTDVDDTAPVFTSALTASFAENGTGTAYTATATDASALTYSLGSGNDESLFDIVGSTGVVTFKSAPDFENPADADANNTYVINVVASDGSNTANQDVTISVTDVDDTAPVFTSALTASFAENGTGAAYTATATDASALTYSLGSGNDESLFDIVGSTGVVTFKSAPDFENPADADANNTYVINVVASDGANNANQDVTISVTDVDDTAPVFTSALTASFTENGTGTAYTATATDASVLTYSLGSGNDESLFDIVGSTGVVTFKSAPDFENPADADANNTYVINVVASDGANNANQDVTISVTDVDDTAPVFTSALTASFAENGTGTAYTATATDASVLTYSLGSGNDESLFDIVGSTGAVTFKSAPDFENPADADANNTYVINVVASDGANSANQDVTISVTDVDDTAPVFTSALTASFAENGTGAAYIIVATGSNTLIYSLGSGNDESLFDIVGSTGVVTFKSAPDFENPADADANNTYVINVVASDGANTANQDVTITVTDVDENLPVADIMIPTAITPNGDGVNDQWQLPGIASFPNSRIAVLDRNGHVVFESKGYATPWDGTDNGKELSPDTYYYSVDLTKDGGKTHKGFVLILK